jgi:xylulokinase
MLLFQIKAVIIDDNLKVLNEENVSFDLDLKEYRTHHGFHEGQDGRVTAPTIMWVKALDLLMEKIRIQGVDLSKVVAISGAGQQHGSVYWRTGASKMLKDLRPDSFMHDELAHAFSILDSPIWMDSSTTRQCKTLEEAIGGPDALAKLTGSRAYERFTGNQIAKIAQDKSEAYSNTERISLVSSFAASLFLGEIAPIDMSDAGGMNLLDIQTQDWSQDCLETCGPDLRTLLGPPVKSDTKLGQVSGYMIDRFGFDPECIVTAFTGDNPASFAGIGLEKGQLCISLGTSDSVMAWLSEDPEPQLMGHIWNNPVEHQSFMALLWYYIVTTFSCRCNCNSRFPQNH